jgi:hypothetical protein
MLTDMDSRRRWKEYISWGLENEVRGREGGGQK